jgi:hypothetical protein
LVQLLKIPWSQAQWYKPVIPALGRLKQKKNHEFKASLGYIAKLSK